MRAADRKTVRIAVIGILLPLAALALPASADPPPSTPATTDACQKPDESLIKSRGGYAGRMEMGDEEKIKVYNAQARAFNDCMRKLIDSGNREMDRVRDDGNAAIKAVAETANRQSRDIAEKMEAAIAGRAAASDAQAAFAGWQFPDADCVVADKTLIRPARGKKSIPAGAQYDTQQRDYRACMQSYLKQAAAEMHKIEASANIRIKEIADHANARIDQLHDQIGTAVAVANHAATDEIQAARGTPYEINPANYFKNGVENVTVEGQPPLELVDTPKGDGDPHTIVCRRPQQLPDSRLPGPEICKRNWVWASLYKAGKDISSDGQTILPAEKSRTTERASMACLKVTTGSPYQGYMTNEVCN